MRRALIVRLCRWALFAAFAALAGLFVASALGAPLPPNWVPRVGDILNVGAILLVFEVGTRGEQRLAAEAVEKRQSLAEENARLRAEAARSAREAGQARERLEAEVRSLRLAYEELRREQLARPPSQAG
jgi:hypothetical protein